MVTEHLINSRLKLNPNKLGTWDVPSLARLPRAFPDAQIGWYETRTDSAVETTVSLSPADPRVGFLWPEEICRVVTRYAWVHTTTTSTSRSMNSGLEYNPIQR